MDFAVVIVPAAPVRKKPQHQVEMVSQLLFGETVQILKTKKNFWIKVRSLHDNYEGWVTKNLIQPIDEKSARSVSEFITEDLMSMILINDRSMNIPAGSSLFNFNNGNGKFGSNSYSFTGNYLNRYEQKPDEELLKQFTFRWLNAPYMWGGRTILGVDCSGFVQVNYKMLGFDLPRDAWQQAQEGKVVKKLKDAVAGDLAFFDDNDEIVHVGILLTNEQIIHAAGRVRIDTIDKKGIINVDTGKRTHRLEAIRRVW